MAMATVTATVTAMVMATVTGTVTATATVTAEFRWDCVAPSVPGAVWEDSNMRIALMSAASVHTRWHGAAGVSCGRPQAHGA